MNQLPLRDRLIDIIPTDKWITRAEIARCLKRAGRLAPHDLITLDDLVFEGLIEKQAVDYRGLLPRWEYRKLP